MIDYAKIIGLILLLNQTVCAQEPLVVAHRGASIDAPENTLPAFKLAWERGADAIEGDFHLTKDGHIVCIHDGNTKKTAGRDIIVAQSTLEELQKLDVGSHHSATYKGVKIPTLAEVFKTIPKGKKIYIEIKSNASIVPQLFKDIESSGLSQDQIVVISFNEGVIEAVETKAPLTKTMLLCGLKKDKAGQSSPTQGSLIKTLNRLKSDGLSTNTAMLTESLIKKIQQLGYEYHVWTVDDPQAAQRMKQWGVQSITTNVPGKMRTKLSSVPHGSE